MDELREEIDWVDNEILSLLAKRKDIIIRVGEYKRENGLEIYNPDREKVLLDKLSKKATELGMSEDYVRKIYSVILERSKEIQKDGNN